jgi:hypothetical protein
MASTPPSLGFSEVPVDDWGEPIVQGPNLGSSRGARPISTPRRLAILIAVVAVVAVIAFATLRNAPTTPVDQVAVVSDTAIPVGPGANGAVYFPFEAVPVSGASDESGSGVVNASIAGEVRSAGCDAGVGSTSCPTFLVEILTNSQLGVSESNASAGHFWCYAPTGTCAPTSVAGFSVDLTAYSGEALNLVVIDPGAAPITVDASVALFWTN